MATLYGYDRKAYNEMGKQIFFIPIIIIIIGIIFQIYSKTSKKFRGTQGKIYSATKSFDTLRLFYNYYVDNKSYSGIHIALSDTVTMDTSVLVKRKFKVLYEVDNPQKSSLVLDKK